jgi:hypothetical protein
MAGYRKVRSCEFYGERATMSLQGESSKMIIEMRTYKLKAGMRENSWKFSAAAPSPSMSGWA